MAKATKGDVAVWLRERATRLPGVEESTTRAGTPTESSTYTVGGKAFLFLEAKEGSYELRLKLGASKAEASRLASKTPDRFAIGATGWAKVTWPKTEAGPRGILERWVDESCALFVPASSKATPGSKAKSAPIVKLVKKPAARAKR